MLRKVPLSDARQASFEEFRARHGRALEDWAAWCALAEVHGPDYRTWPARLRDPRSAETEVRRGDLAAQAEFHTWVQWLVAAQVAAAQAAARAAGMSIGIIADLAIGAHPGGADAWAGQEFFAHGFTVGAPPDAFNQRGQDWGLPPMHPRALAAAGYRPLADLIDANLALGGGLRIDHVMGLSRLWWIPAGAPPTEGAYVYYDAPGTLGTLAAAAAATGSVVSRRGPRHGRAVAARGARRPRRARHADALVRARLVQRAARPAVVAEELPRHGLHARPAARRGVPVRLAGDRPAGARPAHPLRGRGARRGRPHGQRLDRRLRRPGPAARRTSRPTADEFTVALYGYLAKTPALLIGVNLAEAAGETRSQNMPGTCDEYPNWKLPLCGPDGEPGPPRGPGNQRPRPRGRPRRLRRRLQQPNLRPARHDHEDFARIRRESSRRSHSRSRGWV